MTQPVAAAAALRAGDAPPERAPSAGPLAAPTIAVVLAVFAIVWLVHLGSSSLVAPTDDIEQLTWVRSLEWGYHKHPPLPTWLLWLPVKLFGLSPWVAYTMGAACTVAALAVMWRLLVALRGPAFAGVALLAALCITYYNGRLYYYNHNVVLMLLSSASAALCWQAFATRRLRWWLALGLAIGLGALAKYQVAVTIASLLAFAAHQRAWRDPLHRRGALLGALVACAVFAPHLYWLATHGFAPVHYAVESSLGAHFGPLARLAHSSRWLVDQLLNRGLPALVLLVVAARSARGTGPAAAREGASGPPPARDAARALLLSWGLVPMLFMPLVGLAVGADLQLHWGTAFLCFTVPAIMSCWHGVDWDAVDGRRVLLAFGSIQAALLLVSLVTSPLGPPALRDRHWHTFDANDFAQRIAAPARAALGGPIRVVSGPGAVAGALALQLAERPLVLIDGRAERSPWVGGDLVSRCGVLQVGRASELDGARPVGGDFPGLAWRVIARDPAAATCPAPGSVR